MTCKTPAGSSMPRIMRGVTHANRARPQLRRDTTQPSKNGSMEAGIPDSLRRLMPSARCPGDQSTETPSPMKKRSSAHICHKFTQVLFLSFVCMRQLRRQLRPREKLYTRAKKFEFTHQMTHPCAAPSRVSHDHETLSRHACVDHLAPRRPHGGRTTLDQ